MGMAPPQPGLRQPYSNIPPVGAQQMQQQNQMQTFTDMMKILDNIISLSFARNYNDITTDLKSNGIFSSLTAKFNKSSNYKSQLSFISYVRKSNFINRDNSLFKALGYQKIDYVAAGDVLYSTHYLDTHGNNVRKNQSSIEYVIQSMKGQVIRTELK